MFVLMPFERTHAGPYSVARRTVAVPESDKDPGFYLAVYYPTHRGSWYFDTIQRW